jgi:NarL family two-component system response regulator LiaR
MAAGGLSNKYLSVKLFISLRTVKAHMTNIFNKLGCSNRTDAIIKGLKQGYIDLNDIQ